MRSFSPGQCSFKPYGPTTYNAAQRAQAASLSASPPPQRQRAPARLRRVRHAAPAWRWRPQLARRTTGARRRREASRRGHASFIRHGPTTTSAARRALAASLSAAFLPPETKSAGAPAPRKTRGIGWHWRPQLARRTAGARRKEREACRRRSALSIGIGGPQPARHSARAQQVRVLRLPPRDSERWRTCATRDTRCWLGVGGRSWQVAPQARAKCWETSSRGSAISCAMGRSRPARHGARTHKA